jgi:hypothetical protein
MQTRISDKALIILFYVGLLQLEKARNGYLHSIVFQVPATARNVFKYALFDGQGTNEVYFCELQCLYDSYNPDPFVQSFIGTVPRPLFLRLASVLGLTLLVQNVVVRRVSVLTLGERRHCRTTSHSHFRRKEQRSRH